MRTDRTAAPTGGQRPLVHLTPASGWINDPLGLTWHDGRYHLFAQHVPGSVAWSPACHWSHATSEDLLHWRAEPVALAPGEGDDGVWSGCVVRDHRDRHAPARLFYTSVSEGALDIGRIRVARPLDDAWTTWEKGPVVAEVPQGVDAVAFRDPFVLRDGDRWRMVVGGGLADGTAVAWTYVSADLDTWTPDGELARRHTSQTDPLWTGTAWECVQLLPLDEHWVLVFSVWEPGAGHHGAYAVGELAEGRFTARSWGRLTHGPAPYASSAFLDREDRPGLVHWLRGVGDPDGTWAGALSVPHLLTLDGEVLVAAPHPVVTSGAVVGTARPGHDVVLPPAAWVDWADGALDAQGTTGVQGASEVDGPRRLVLTAADGTALADLARDGAVLTVTTAVGDWEVPAPTGAVGILVDRLVLEVFTRGGVLGVPLPPATGDVRLAIGDPGGSSAGHEPGAARVRAVG